MLRDLYRSLRRIRRVEEEIARVYPTDVIKSPVHLSIGQEAVSVGVCHPLRPGDACFGTYRSHAYYLAKGGDLPAMIAELYGKATGCGKGKAGSMHLVDTRRGVIGASAVVASTIPNAVGYAFGQKHKGPGPVTVAFFGDGAMEEGVFWESLNFAVLHRLPVLFVCENNLYAIHAPLLTRQRDARLAERAGAFGLPATRLDGNDVEGIVANVEALLPAMRAREEGPAFLECTTYRFREHVGPGEDFHLGYRSREEAAEWMSRDALPRLAALLDPAEREAFDAAIETEIAAAFRAAEEAPWPAPAELHTEVFA